MLLLKAQHVEEAERARPFEQGLLFVQPEVRLCLRPLMPVAVIFS